MKRYYWSCVIQVAILISVSALVAIVKPYIWFEYFVGGLIAIIPHAWFTYRVINTGRVRNMLQVVAMANRAAIEKYVLSSCGFATVFVLLETEYFLVVFIGFFTALAAQVFGSVLLSRTQSIN